MRKMFITAIIALMPGFIMAQTDWTLNPVGKVFAANENKMPEGTFKLCSGGYEVFTIASSDKSYQPASLYYGENEADKQKVDRMVPDGKVPTAMNCFVVKTPGGYIMFDTGLPASKGGKTLERLNLLGISPKDIKSIYLTHGHFDHIGGLLGNGNVAAYPNAEIYVSASEADALRSDAKSGFQQIETAYTGRIEIFRFGEVLPDNVLPIAAEGHTPGHTAFQLGNLIFVGDLMHGQKIQLIDPTICAGFDADRSASIETRRRILSYSAANSLTVLGSHIPLNGIIF